MAAAVVNQGVDKYGVAWLLLNRPQRQNALDNSVFEELPLLLRSLDSDPQVCVIVLSGTGPSFCSGIDLSILGTSQPSSSAQERDKFNRYITWMQNSLSSPELCRKPVIASIHGSCLGGGVDLITACDLRYATKDATFSVKEVDLAITADLGSLQRLPGIIGYAKTMELALTAKTFNGAEAKNIGLVSEAFDSKEELDASVMKVARQVAAKSALAIQGTKDVLLKGRDMTVSQGLQYVATRNSALLSVEEVGEAIRAMRMKRKPVFAKL